MELKKAWIKMLTAIFLTDTNDQIFKKALESASFAEKILIFDYQSQNDWKKLKKNLPQIKIVRKTGRINDFAAVRNEAISLVRTNWLLFVDSDEVLQENAEKEISKLIKKGTDAYTLERVDVFHNKKLNWGELRKVKLIRLARTEKIKFKRKVHEEAMITGTIANSNLKLTHYAHQNIETFFASVNNYAQIEAKYRKENNWPYSKSKMLLEFFFFPGLKFIHNYLFKLGFLDGFAGFVYATLMSMHSLLVRIYLYEEYFLA